MKYLAVILLFSLEIFAKEKPTVTIQITDAKTWNRDITRTIPGKKAHSETNCTSTDIGNNVNTDCQTTTTPGTPATSYTISRENVTLYAIMPDGSKVSLWCEANWRMCLQLNQGEYKAEIDKDTVWVYVTSFTESQKYSPDGTMLPRKTKIDRVKYKIK